MMKIFLGFTFLLSACIPFGARTFFWILNHTSQEFVDNFSYLQINFASLLCTYIVSGIIIAVFFKFSHLKDRISSPPPAKNIMLAGVTLTIVYLSISFAAATIEGGGGLYTVAQFSPFLVFPARLLLVIGAVKVLLCANPQPRNSA